MQPLHSDKKIDFYQKQLNKTKCKSYRDFIAFGLINEYFICNVLHGADVVISERENSKLC